MSDQAKFMLLAEDDAVVAELVIHSLRLHNPTINIVHVRDGVEAMDFLHARARYEDRDPGNPTVILLDVKMPRLDGLEVLRLIKGTEHLKMTPVVMLTSSQHENDIRESYNLGANAYVVKPVEFRSFASVLQQIDHFWMGVNQPPPAWHSTRTDSSGRRL